MHFHKAMLFLTAFKWLIKRNINQCRKMSQLDVTM